MAEDYLCYRKYCSGVETTYHQSNPEKDYCKQMCVKDEYQRLWWDGNFQELWEATIEKLLKDESHDFIYRMRYLNNK